MGMSALPAFGQQQLDRVEVTGSSIRRIDAESALPVQVLKREDIERSGVTSTVDLLKKVTSVQGSTGESASVGGTTFGFSGVSIHNVGETRTLVLLNGHRLALFGGQTLTGFAAGIDLNSIPVSSIERVEVLTDGASALYGADAIAGVVNFITKRDTTAGDVTIGFSNPKGGAKEKRISATKGFGSLQEDGFNFIMSFGHDERTQLNATDRDFGNTGLLLFSQNGKNYRFQQSSGSSIPGNIADDHNKQINPYLIKNGACAPGSFRLTNATGDSCRFDFVQALEIYPERKRDSVMTSFTKKVGEQELFADLLLSRTKQVSRIAPVPGGIAIEKSTDPNSLWMKYINGLNNVDGTPLQGTDIGGGTIGTIANYRLSDLGKRTNRDQADFVDLSLGSRGTVASWDYTAMYTHSRSKVKSEISGYPGGIAVGNLTDSGLLDPFVLAGQQSAAAQSAINAISFNGYWDGGQTDLDTVQVHGSRELFAMANGPLSLGLGASFSKEKFQSKPSLFAQGKLSDPAKGVVCDSVNAPETCDQRFGDSSATVPYSADRKAYGLFGELIIPVLKTLELSAAVRYDHYNDFGNASTAKGSFRWTPDKSVLVRGSIGTGFHAPTVPQVNAARQPFGVTSGEYSCTDTSVTPSAAAIKAQADALGAACQPGSKQYDVIAAGNKDLQPEKSIQGTLGIRIEPSANLSFGADLWHVGIRDSFGQLAENSVFANPAAYPKAWSTNKDVATGVTYLAFNNQNVNLGKFFSTGIDFDVSGRLKTGIGDVMSQVTATYMIREVQQLEADGAYYSAIGDYDSNLGTVTFRWQGRWATSLKTDNWVHTLGINFKSGYKDQEQSVDVLDNAGNRIGGERLRLDVHRYYTADWQSMFNITKTFSVTAGLLNVFNTSPPLSLATAGTNKGQPFGYDDRYYDPRGRTVYMNASYKF
jgi:iron complex outermembrane receptor protein